MYLDSYFIWFKEGDLSVIFKEGGYSDDQIFNVDEAALFWKLPPTRTIKQRTKKIAGLKLPKSRSTVLFGGNASGKLKLKPLFIHTALNPRCMKGVKKEDLPVFWTISNHTTSSQL